MNPASTNPTPESHSHQSSESDANYGHHRLSGSERASAMRERPYLTGGQLCSDMVADHQHIANGARSGSLHGACMRCCQWVIPGFANAVVRGFATKSWLKVRQSAVHEQSRAEPESTLRSV